MGGEVVWSVIYAIGLLLAGVGFVIYWIMHTAYIEMSTPIVHEVSEPEEMITEESKPAYQTV